MSSVFALRRVSALHQEFPMLSTPPHQKDYYRPKGGTRMGTEVRSRAIPPA